ncbi:MAG: DUF2267 domain-containing protein [Sandaracinaceae bacterium]
MNGNDLDTWVAHVAHEAGIASTAHARAALVTVIDAMGAMVPHPRRGTVAAALPPELGEAFGRRDYDRSLGEDWLLEVVAEGEHVRTGSAVEHVQSVLSVLREALDPDLYRILLHELPEDVAALVPARRSSAPPPGVLQPTHGGVGHHLSDGRPGYAKPIAESAPPPRAQSHSVAASDDPHADTKLSEAKGLTQEREHTSLSEAHPTPQTLAKPEDDA